MQKDSARSWVVIVLVGIALTISQADRSLLPIAAPRLVSEQQISGTALGVLLSSFAWTYTIFQLPSGWLVDRYGPKRVLSLAFVCWSLACAATGLSASFAYLLACRLLLGVFEAPLYAVAHSTMARAFTASRRGLATSIYTKGASLGPALGALVGSYLLVHFGWSTMFLAVGVGSLAFLIPWQLLVPAALHAPERETHAIDWSTATQLLKTRAVWGISIGYFGFLYLYYLYVTWLPTYLSTERGLTTTEIAWMSSVPSVVSLFAGPASGWLADSTIGRGYSETRVRKTAIGIGLLLEGAVIPAAYTADAFWAAVCFVVALAGQAIAATNMLALPSAIAPKGHAGLIGSFQQMMGAMGGIVSPVVTGVLLDATHDFRAGVWSAGAMLVLAAISFIVVTPRIETIQLRYSTHTDREPLVVASDAGEHPRGTSSGA